MASYNYDALDENMPYGNPWQPLWVLDGKKSTRVVCEGYAKAFKYLCDLTKFKKEVTVLTAAGVIKNKNSKNPEDHMWNIVSMENGRNYLVDLTFADNEDTKNTLSYDFILVGKKKGSVKSGFTIKAGENTYTYKYEPFIRELYEEKDLKLAGSALKFKERTASKTKCTKIEIFAPSKTVAAGKSIKLRANLFPKSAAGTALKWSSSDRSVATVDAGGKVSFKKTAGGKKVKITAEPKKGKGAKGTITLSCMKGKIKSIKISGKKTVKAGKTLTLKAKIKAESGADKTLRWESSNVKYATVRDGKVRTSASAGGKTVTITAKAADGSGKKASFKIKIK